MWAHPGKKLLFMGGEFGQWREWNHDESLDWHLLQWPDHQGLQRLVADLNALYRAEPALHQVDFDWHGLRVARAARLGEQRPGLPPPGPATRATRSWSSATSPRVVREGYRIGVPDGGCYREILNTDAEIYGGSNVGQQRRRLGRPRGTRGAAFHLPLRLPPLAVVILKRDWDRPA